MKTPIRYLKNPGGPVLGVTTAPVLEIGGLYFKDLARQGVLLPYEDWRLPPEERARDLAARLSVEEIAGQMMYSAHQMVPAISVGPFVGTYGGKSLADSGAAPTDLTDQQRKFLETDHVRHVLAAGLENAEIAAGWNNEMQAFVEELPFGIPVNISSDPRHGASAAGAEYKSGGGRTQRCRSGISG